MSGTEPLMQLTIEAPLAGNAQNLFFGASTINRAGSEATASGRAVAQTINIRGFITRNEAGQETPVHFVDRQVVPPQAGAIDASPNGADLIKFAGQDSFHLRAFDAGLRGRLNLGQVVGYIDADGKRNEFKNVQNASLKKLETAAPAVAVQEPVARQQRTPGMFAGLKGMFAPAAAVPSRKPAQRPGLAL